MANNEESQALKQKLEEEEKQPVIERKEAAVQLETLKQDDEIQSTPEEAKSRMEALQSEIKELLLENKSLKDTNVVLNNTISTNLDEIRKLEAQINTLSIDAEKSSAKIQELDIAKKSSDKALQESMQSLSAISKVLQEAQSQYSTEKKKFELELDAFRKENETLIGNRKQEEEEKSALLMKIKSLEEIYLNLSKIISTNQEEVGTCTARINALTVDVEKSSSKIQELEKAKDASDEATKGRRDAVDLLRMIILDDQSQHHTKMKSLELKLDAFENNIDILNQKIEEVEEKEATKQWVEEMEAKERSQEERVMNRVQPRNNAEGESSSTVFKLMPLTEPSQKLMLNAGTCPYIYNALDINKYNVVAVTYDKNSVYLYSEITKIEELLCVCPFSIISLAWNQQGTLLAVGGDYLYCPGYNSMQIWDVPSRKIIKRLKIENDSQRIYCLDWNGDTITAGTNDYIYQWHINDPYNDKDAQGKKALLPTYNKLSKYVDMTNMQWSDCKSKLATITNTGIICIYNEELKLIHQFKAQKDNSSSFLQWCPWDNQVIAAYCQNEYIRIWGVGQNIMLIKEVKHESIILNMKWIPSRKAIITAHKNNKMILWDYPSLCALKTMNGHTHVPYYLALNADKSAIVSKSGKEMIFWKPFDQL